MRTLALSLALVLAIPCSAQQWSQRFSDAPADLNASTPLPAGGFLLAGARYEESVSSYLGYVVEVDAMGVDQGIDHLQGGIFEDVIITDILLAGGRRYLAVSREPSGFPEGIALIEHDGTRVSSRRLPNSRRPVEVEPAPGDGVYVSCVQASDRTPLLMRLDSGLSPVWQRRVLGLESGISSAPLAALPDGSVVLGLTSSTSGTPYFNYATLMHFSADGDLLYQKVIDNMDAHHYLRDLAADGSGGVTAVGSVRDRLSNDGWPWIARFDASGMLSWQHVFDLASFENLQSVAVRADGSAVAAGTFGPSGAWQPLVVELDSDGVVEWARSYWLGGSAGARDIEVLADDSLLLLGGTEAGASHLAADGTSTAECVFVTDRSVGLLPAPGDVRDSSLTAPANTGLFSADDLVSAVFPASVGCQAQPCTPLVCAEIVAMPEPPCGGRMVTLMLDVTGGEGAVTVEWDLDDDGVIDVTGNPVDVVIPVGSGRIEAFASDSCSGAAQQCGDVDFIGSVFPSTPREPSNVFFGDPPLLVGGPDKSDVTFSFVAPDEQLHVHAGRIGAWNAPDPALTTCWYEGAVRNPDFTVTAPGVLAESGTWVVVTASEHCWESSAGRDSFGVERDQYPGWMTCTRRP